MNRESFVVMTLNPAEWPDGTTACAEDQAPAIASTLVPGLTACTFLDFWISQWAGTSPLWAAAYIVPNASGDGSTDLANSAVRIPIYLQNGIGMGVRIIKPEGSILTAHYKCTSADANIVLNFAWK